jgi:hypothetical protein
VSPEHHHLMPHDSRSAHVRDLRCRVCLRPLRKGEFRMTVYFAEAHQVVCCASCAAKFETNPSHYMVE